ncbi:MAG: hypothetical protein OXP09_17385 [Gammaproteobacteria bacterium]|nr:hypothetical protein [Gammaproteobacteria bacterium]
MKKALTQGIEQLDRITVRTDVFNGKPIVRDLRFVARPQPTIAHANRSSNGNRQLIFA